MRHPAQQQSRRIRGNGLNNGTGGTNPGGQRRGFQNKNRVFDSNGPDVRIRGTAHQIVEKYTALAKDASASGDRVLAESYLQYAEHYQRIINSWIEEFGEDALEDTQRSATSYESAEPGPSSGARPAPSSSAGEGGEEELGLPSSILGMGVRPKASQELSDA